VVYARREKSKPNLDIDIVVHPAGETLNQLFDTLSAWSAYFTAHKAY
jgi:hypothetical protein